MARLPIAIPPGLFLNGTALQAKGRWRDANLTRWYGSSLGPVLGWRIRNAATAALTGLPRAALAWKDNGANSWLAIGTHSKLYVCNIAGAKFDITPTVSFTSGRADASASGGYGSGLYGTGYYGVPRPGNTETLDATEWTLQTWGEDLVAVSPNDGKLRLWDTSVGTGTVAATVSGAPACKAVVVTAERFVMALATADPRTVDWCDQEDITTWSPSSTNQAGSFPLQTAGRLMCGYGVRGGTILLTDQDAHLATYIGGTLVYSFDKIGDGCGAISRQAGCVINEQAVWMSGSGFWQSIGSYVRQIPCDVMDYIRQDINLLQQSKVVCVPNAVNSEVEWRYCSSASTEIDRCVVWNWQTGAWTIGRASRTCGVDKGVFPNPILVSSAGIIYDHEVGWAYDGASPYATTGPIELGNGDKIMHILGMYPDDQTEGDVTASFTVRRNPDDTGVVKGPYSLTAKTDLRFSGGLIEMTVTGNAMTNWRSGIPKLEVMPGEGR